MPKILDFNELMLEKVALSGLDETMAHKLKFESMTGAEAVETLGVGAELGGFMIPYFDFDGEVTSFWRYRYMESSLNGFEKLSGKKEMRYVQPRGSLNQIYMAPLLNWAKLRDDTKQPVVITEGELKAACACSLGIPTIGLGGVWCFRSAVNHMSFLPQLEEFSWDGRTVYICYDSDAVSNTMIVQAENTLAKELLRYGARVHIVRLPSLVPPTKTGLDDFLVSEGKQEFMELLGRAVEWQTAKELFELNGEVVYVRDPGIILKMDTLQKLSPRAFTEHAYSTRRFFEEVPAGKNKVKLVEKGAANEWLRWPARSEVQRMTYLPGEPRLTKHGDLNIWRGWGAVPVEGDIKPWQDLMKYVFENSPEEQRWFERWLAYPLQHPGEKLYTAAVIWGTQHGTGKSLIGYTMFKIYGENAAEITDRELASPFNEWAEHKQFAMGDEITGGDKRHSADRMKSMITQKWLRMNQKFMPSYVVPDCINYYFTSNHPDAFFIEDTDRRFFVHELSRRPLPPEFYKAYERWMNGDGARALFDYLLRLDLSGFNPQAPAPMTGSKRDMIESGRSDIGSWVAALRDYPDSVLRIGDKVLKHQLMTATELHSIYDQRGNGRTTINGMSREMSRAGFEKAFKGMPVITDHGPQRLWVVRSSPASVETMNGRELSELYHKERGLECKRTTKS